MLVELLILGAVIGSNNFAASLALGSIGQFSRRWRIIAVFGAFEFCIPLVGLWIGQRTAQAVGDIVSWLGPVVLGMLGAWTIYSAYASRTDTEELASRITRLRGLIALAAGLSLDNLVAGFSLGLGKASPLLLASSIAAFSVLFSYVGLRLGHLARESHRRLAKVTTGLLLIGLALALKIGAI